LFTVLHVFGLSSAAENQAMQARSRSRRAALVAVVLASVAAMSACNRSCGGHDGDRDASPDAESSGAVGVRECDDYVSKLAACISNKVPDERKKAMEDGLERTRTTWKTLAANPGARPGLPQTCQLASETTRTIVKQYGCVW
jgi:hypothetical protein